jgi:hypothetical protein
VPNALNCLLSATHFDDAGGKFKGGNGKCLLKDKTYNIVAEGIRVEMEGHNYWDKKGQIMPLPLNYPGINGTDTLDIYQYWL